MTDPYEVLGLPQTADEAEIRRRYLELVRQFPPDRDPARFSEVRSAYDLLRDPARRLEALLLRYDTGETIAAITLDLQSRIRGRLTHLPLASLIAMADAP